MQSTCSMAMLYHISPYVLASTSHIWGPRFRFIFSCHQQDEEDSNEAKMDTLIESVTYIVKKMKEQETLKFYEEEQQKQQEWIQKNAGGRAQK